MAFSKTILQVIPAMEAGGAERTTLEMTCAIIKAGGGAIVATSGGRMTGAVEAAGGRVALLPVQSKNPLEIVANASRLSALIRAENVDLIHARSRAPAWSALLAARRTQIPFVTTWHGAYRAGTPWKRLYNSAMARGDLVIANSAFTAETIRAVSDPGNRLIVIPRGADIDEFNPQRVTQSRIEATLTALERLAQGELTTADDFVPFDMTELLDRAAHDAERTYPELAVSLVPSPAVLMVGLPVGLRLVVDNAIANAVKHGGATEIRLAVASAADGVLVTVDDNGSGVPEHERADVFERFTRGSTASRSGSGLGLALVAQQAELHGGTAALETSPLGGARLVLRLAGRP